MEDEGKNELSDTDIEMDNENKSRRSSILKPQKARNPLSTLDFSEAYADTTMAKPTRRVSFATSNFIKPFAADAERNTIWDTTYEEEVNHTDSTKSSYDHTHASKTSECLNMTSIHSVTDLSQHATAIVTSITAQCPDIVAKLQAPSDINPGESLISIARKLRSKSMEQEAKNETMEFTLINKTTEEVDTENVSLFNKTSNISCSTTKFAETMDITLCVDKENVNPLINDVSLALPRRTCSISSSTTKCFTEEMDFTKPVEKMENTVYFGLSENNLDFTGLDATQTNDTRLNNTKKRECEMELTCVVSGEMANKENVVTTETQECKLRRKTVLFNETEGNMDLTIPDNTCLVKTTELITDSRYDISQECKSRRQTIHFNDAESNMDLTVADNACLVVAKEIITELRNDTTQECKSRRETIHFNETEGNMDLTVADNASLVETKKIITESRNDEAKIDLKRRTILFKQSEDDMEFTSTFPIKIQDNGQINTPRTVESIKQVETMCEKTPQASNYACGILKNWVAPDQQQLASLNSQKTICFNESEGEMEFTNVFSIKKDTVDLTDLKRKMSKSKSKMDCTDNLVGDIYSCVDTTSNDLAENMELTKVCPSRTIMENDIVEGGKDKTVFEGDMELTTDFPVKSFKQDICAVNTDKPINEKGQNNLITVDTKELSDCIAREQPDLTASTSLHLTLAVANNLHHTETFSCRDNTDRVLDVENVQQKSAFADKCEKENPVSSVQKRADVKRHLDVSINNDIKKRKIHNLVPGKKTSEICGQNNLKSDIVDKENVYSDSAMDSNGIESDSKNVLASIDVANNKLAYSEPVKVKSAVPDLSANIDIDCTMNMHHVSTAANSFHINLSPETLKFLNSKRHTDTYILDPDNTAGKLEESSVKKVEFAEVSQNKGRTINEKTFTKENSKLGDVCLQEIGVHLEEMSLKDDKSYFLDDTTPLLVAPGEFDCSNPEVQPPNHDNADPDTSLKSNTDSSSSYKGDYTLRSEMVLTNIEKNLLVYVPASPLSTVNRSKLSRQFKENTSVIKELCKRKNTRVVDLEEIHRRYIEEIASTETDVTENAEEDLKASAMLGLIAPKSLRERISEMSKSCKTYWELIKTEDHYYFFYTLFETLPFKVHVHPDLGIVYSVGTYSNLSDIAPPICRYELEIFMHKLKQEHLLSVLGTKFDIITLLDYVYLSMEEIIDFHKEYLSLLKKYGRSHQLTMNPDFSITFKILNVKSIIAWVITIKLPATNLLSITKEDVTAEEIVGQKVNIEHIRGIVENTPKGPNFLRNFIENVDDYVTRIGKRIRR